MIGRVQKMILGCFLMTQAQGALGTEISGLLGVVNKADGTASLIDVASGDTRVIPVGRLPHEIAFGNGFAFVSNYGSNHIRSSDLADAPGNTISVIDLSDASRVSEIDLGPARCAPHGLAASPAGERLYVTCEGRHEIAVIDVIGKKVSHFIPTNQAGSHLIVISKDESFAYVSNFWHGTVSVIDLQRKKLVQQIRTGRGVEGIGLSADDRFVFATRVEDGEILKIDTQTFEIVQKKTVAAGTSPIRVIAGPSRLGVMLVNNVGAGTMSVLRVADMSVVHEIKVGRQPIGIASSEGDHAFAANMKDRTISVINVTTGVIEKQFSTGAAPDGIALR